MDEYIKRKDAFDILQSRLDSISQMSYLNMDWHELDIMRDAIQNAIDDVGEVPAADIQPVKQWISVKDRQPKCIHGSSDSVLVCRDNGECEVAYLVYDNDDGFYWYTQDERSAFEFEEVTHWMPLPELPQD